MNQSKRDSMRTAARLLIIGAIFLTAYLVLIARLWHEQVSLGAEHRQKISRQSVRRIRTPALRGRIYAADGTILADNRPRFDAKLYLEEMRRPGRRSKTVNHILKVAETLAKLIGRDSPLTREKVIRHINIRPGLPLTLFANLSPREMGILHEVKHRFRGLSLEVAPERFYPHHSLCSHLIGFTGKADPRKASDRKKFFYYVPDLSGRRGIEKLCNSHIPGDSSGKIRGLSGLPGSRLVMVDHRGFVYRTIRTDIAAINGNDIFLTIDFRAQSLAEQLLQGKRGAMVLLDADSGAVLAMASKPDFDPNIFTSGNSRAIRQLYRTPGQPLLNRATKGTYTPGSIVKPLTSIALLNNGLSPSATIYCDGATWIGKTRIRCDSWRSGGHGKVNLLTAIEVSCNDFFIEEGLKKLKMEQLRDILLAAGLGRKSGFCLAESSGIAPSRVYKLKRYKRKWNSYDTALLCIGQGIITITPLQAAVYCAALANGGTIWRPFIIKEVRDQFGNLLYRTQPTVRGKLPVSAKNLQIVRQGMRLVVEKGTGRRARNDKIVLYGKTGTAEVGPRHHRHNNTWFICFGTKAGKTYALAIIIEKGRSGGKTCAPLAAEFFSKWLK